MTVQPSTLAGLLELLRAIFCLQPEVAAPGPNSSAGSKTELFANSGRRADQHISSAGVRVRAWYQTSP